MNATFFRSGAEQTKGQRKTYCKAAKKRRGKAKEVS
jgi:hypothetical protein